MKKISTFDDWIEYFRDWQKDIGYDAVLLSDYTFETKLGELHSPDIEFGDFKGQHKWERVGQIPNQSIRDALMNLIVPWAIGVRSEYSFESLANSCGLTLPSADMARASSS